MKAEILSWHLHRLRNDHLKWYKPFNKNDSKERILFLTERDIISLTQIFPLYFYQSSLGLSVRELPIGQFLKNNNIYCNDRIDVVCFQTWFNLSSEDINNIVYKIKHSWPEAKIVFFDFFAPTDLRYAKT
jgi:hypothetical protein